MRRFYRFQGFWNIFAKPNILRNFGSVFHAKVWKVSKDFLRIYIRFQALELHEKLYSSQNSRSKATEKL